jgi:hypothetical protein
MSLLALKAYPRVCRNGHTIESPRGEHVGAHRQCKECRLASQKRANERYDWHDGNNGLVGWSHRVRKTISKNNILIARDERRYAEWQQEVRTKYGDEVLQSLIEDTETPDGLFSVEAVTEESTQR